MAGDDGLGQSNWLVEKEGIALLVHEDRVELMDILNSQEPHDQKATFLLRTLNKTLRWLRHEREAWHIKKRKLRDKLEASERREKDAEAALVNLCRK